MPFWALFISLTVVTACENRAIARCGGGDSSCSVMYTAGACDIELCPTSVSILDGGLEMVGGSSALSEPPKLTDFFSALELASSSTVSPLGSMGSLGCSLGDTAVFAAVP